MLPNISRNVPVRNRRVTELLLASVILAAFVSRDMTEIRSLEVRTLLRGSAVCTGHHPINAVFESDDLICRRLAVDSRQGCFDKE